VQLPVFISMYAVLDVAVELRQQPFIGWIADLSQPDRLVSFDSPIPLLLFSIDAINLLPVVMAATWAVQMYMTPAPATDPQQVQTQKMMRWMMPTLFFFFCYDLASGLSLYFFVNSLLGILESKLVRTFILKPEEAAPEAAAAAGAKSNR
jgi:YidC/Oxa1 family membrane protein insertase